jgi:dTMP kinase
LIPDLTILLDLDPQQARVRLDAEDKVFDRLENEKQDFHTRVREGFLALAAAEPQRWLVLNAADDREVLAASIATAVNNLLSA